MPWLEILAGIGGLISLIVLIGGTAALLRSSYNKARMEALREDNEDLRARVSDLEATENRLMSVQAAAGARIKHLEEENAILMEGLTQRAEVSSVKTMLERHHTEAMTAWTLLGNLMERILESQDRGEA